MATEKNKKTKKNQETPAAEYITGESVKGVGEERNCRAAEGRAGEVLRASSRGVNEQGTDRR